MFPGGHDNVEGDTGSALLPHDPFRFQRQFRFRDTGCDLRHDLLIGQIGQANCLADQRQLLGILD